MDDDKQCDYQGRKIGAIYYCNSQEPCNNKVELANDNYCTLEQVIKNRTKS